MRREQIDAPYRVDALAARLKSLRNVELIEQQAEQVSKDVRIATPKGEITIVGDSDQSSYRCWRCTTYAVRDSEAGPSSKVTISDTSQAWSERPASIAG